jgi:hypothetical protein
VTSLPIALHARAAAEVRENFLWYRKRSAFVADAFAAELDRAMSAIAEAPDRWPRYLSIYRQFHLAEFPYSIFYQLLPDRISVFAVAAHRKRPDYWKRRK